MKSLSTEQLFFIATSASLLAVVFLFAIIYVYSKLTHVSAEALYKATLLNEELEEKTKIIADKNLVISKLENEVKATNLLFDNLKIESAELEAKVEIFKKQNNELLKAAQDDVTLSIKAESVVVPVERKKRPYFKKKKNAGSTTSKSKMGKV